MWIAGLAVIAAIAATYHLPRPPELVWWTSPAIGNSGRRLRMLIPNGWEAGRSYLVEDPRDHWTASYGILPAPDRLPKLIRLVLRRNRQEGYLRLSIYWNRKGNLVIGSAGERQTTNYSENYAFHRVVLSERHFLAAADYVREGSTALNATSEDIFNSLRIE